MFWMSSSILSIIALALSISPPDNDSNEAGSKMDFATGSVFECCTRSLELFSCSPALRVTQEAMNQAASFMDEQVEYAEVCRQFLNGSAQNMVRTWTFYSKTDLTQIST